MFPLIAVVAALGSSLAYAITAVTEQLGTHRVQRRRALSPELLLDLIKQPLWLAGIGANVASFALQVVALRFGPLALVEPILVCDLIFAGLISAALRKPRTSLRARELSPARPGSPDSSSSPGRRPGGRLSASPKR